MTIKTIAAVVAALILFAIPNISEASFDRHTPNNDSQAHSLPAASHSRSPTAQRRAAKKHQHSKRAVVTKGDHVVVAKSGARASVSIAAKPHFVCLIEKLEATGYKIDFMGGYAERGNSSAHPTGNALDINQTGRNVITRRLPAGVSQMASACGLVHGGGWLSHPDQGHFEMPKKYGYIYRTHRTRLARVH